MYQTLTNPWEYSTNVIKIIHMTYNAIIWMYSAINFMFCTNGHVVYILPKMDSLVLASDQVFSEYQFWYGVQVTEFREQ